MEVSDLFHPHFTFSKDFPRTYWIGGWVGPQASLDKVMKRKISANAGNQTLDIKHIANHNTAILKTSVPTSQKHTLSLLQKPNVTAVYRNNHLLF